MENQTKTPKGGATGRDARGRGVAVRMVARPTHFGEKSLGEEETPPWTVWRERDVARTNPS